MAYLGHKPAVGENNSFRILDDISSFVLTFDGSSASAVGLSDETITITENNHRFITGQRVTYSNGGGGNITGLVNGQAYFVINHSKTQIKLASSASNALAGTAINLTGLGTGSSHTLTLAFDGVNTKFVPTFGDGMHDTLIKRAAQLVISLNGVIQQPHDTATPSTGFGVDSLGNLIFSTAPASTDIFWAHVLATNTVTFDSSDNDVDTFTGNGSTTSFTLSKTPPNNRNILVTIDGVVQYPSDAANTRSYNLSENVMTFVAAPGNGTSIQVRHIGYAGPAANGGGGVTGFYGRVGNVSLIATDNILANDATFSGNVSIAKTLTYEDVTDIDSVGLITARSGIKDSTLTAGHVVFAGTAGRLSGEANLFYDSSNDRLGIGTNNPKTTLNAFTYSPSDTGGILVQNALYTSNLNKPYLIAGTNNWTGATTNWNTYGFQHKLKSDSTGQPRVTIDTIYGGGLKEIISFTSGGNVGIASDSPSEKLDVIGNIKAGGDILIPTNVDSTNASGVAIQRFWSTGSITAGNIYKCGRWNEGEGSVQLLINVRAIGASHSGSSTYLFQGGFNVIGGTGISRLTPVSSGYGHGNNADTGIDNNSWGVLIHQHDSYTYAVWVYNSTGTATKSLQVSVTELNRGNNFTDISESVALSSVSLNAGTKKSIRTTAIEELHLSDNGIIHDGDTNTKIHFNTDTIKFDTAGSERLRISSTGLVGIGTITPGEALHLGDNHKIALGYNQVLELHHNGSTGYINNSSGILNIVGAVGQKIDIKDGSAYYIRCNSTNSVELFYNGGSKFSTKDYGATLNGNMRVTTGGDGYTFISDPDTGMHNPSDGNLYFKVNGGNKLAIDSSGNAMFGTTSSTVYDDTSGSGVVIRSATGAVDIMRNNDHPLLLNRTGGDGQMIMFHRDGVNKSAISVRSNALCFDMPSGTEKLRIQSTGVVNIGDSTASSLGDRLLQIGKTDRSGTYIELRTSTSGVGGIVMSDGTANSNTGYRGTIEYAHGSSNSDSMYFKTAAQERLRITSNGCVNIGGDYSNTTYELSVTGGSSQQMKVVGGEADIWLESTGGSSTYWRILGSTGGSTHQFRIYDQTNSADRLTIDSAGKTTISVNKDSTALVIDGTSSGTSYGETGGRIEFLMLNEVNQFTGNFAARISPYLDRGNNGFGLKFDVRHNASTTYKILDLTSDYEVLPGVDNTISLGNSSYRWSNLYIADLQLSNKGKTNDVDGTWGNYTIQEGESELFLINNRNGKKYKFNLTEVS